MLFLITSFPAQVFAQGDINEVIYGCVNNSSGTVKIVGTDEECQNNETQISWNSQGVPGPIDPLLLGRISALETQVSTLQEQIADLVEDATDPELSINDISLMEGAGGCDRICIYGNFVKT